MGYMSTLRRQFLSVCFASISFEVLRAEQLALANGEVVAVLNHGGLENAAEKGRRGGEHSLHPLIEKSGR